MLWWMELDGSALLLAARLPDNRVAFRDFLHCAHDCFPSLRLDLVVLGFVETRPVELPNLFLALLSRRELAFTRAKEL